MSTSLTRRFLVVRYRISSNPLVGLGPKYRPSRNTYLLFPLPFQWYTTSFSSAIRSPLTSTLNLPSRVLFRFCWTVSRTTLTSGDGFQ